MATDDFILAPNARWQGRDETGQPIQNGKLYTYLNQTTTPKATYQDYLGLQPNTNPVILDGKGEANIYWATDDLYTIKLFTEDDEEVYTQDNYPVVGTNTTRVVAESESNIARNNQFFYWYFGTSFSPVAGVGSAGSQDYVCDDWYYSRVGTSYTVNITRQTFAIDQDTVPGNPVYFLRYEATSAPSGETNNRLYQTYQSVQTLAGLPVTVGMRLKSPTASTVNVYLVQYFGTGGSPSATVTNLVGQFDLTTSWQQFSGTITLPSMAGKTVGTNGDDALILQLNYPNDVVGTVDVCNVQFQSGSTLSNFPFQSKETMFQELVNRVQDGVFSTGDVKPTLKTTADPGWIMCNDQTIGNTTSGATNTGISLKALYTLIWTNVTNQYAPIYTSAGVLTTRGASAEADFNALKRLALTKTLGRVIASAGQAILAQTITAVDTGADTLTVGFTDNIFYNSTPVTVSNSGGGLPAPLLAATTYYAVRQNSTTVKLATTAANAINGTFIDITTTGSGTNTIEIDYSAWTLGQPAGEETHGSTLSETAAHSHTGSHIRGGDGAGGSDQEIRTGTLPGAFDVNVTMTSNGSSAVHNNMQPTVFLRYMMRM
jgi:hypothetical protein